MHQLTVSLLYRFDCITYHYLSLPFQFAIIPASTVKVTKDTIKISKLQLWTYPCSKGQTVQLKDTDPNELQRFIEKLPSSIKGKTKSMNVISNTFF